MAANEGGRTEGTSNTRARKHRQEVYSSQVDSDGDGLAGIRNGVEKHTLASQRGLEMLGLV